MILIFNIFNKYFIILKLYRMSSKKRPSENNDVLSNKKKINFSTSEFLKNLSIGDKST